MSMADQNRIAECETKISELIKQVQELTLMLKAAKVEMKVDKRTKAFKATQAQA